MADLIEVEDLLDRVLETVRPLDHFPQPLLEAVGLPVCEDVVAPVGLPVFDNSGMDGYAVLHHDVATATSEMPIHLPVVGEIGAGHGGLMALSPGTAAKIMTGARVPAGCDAVVPYEWTDRGVAEVVIHKAPSLGQHIRRAGEDVEEGDVLVEDSSVLGPRQIGLLAAVGRERVLTRPRPRVVVISTGSELRDPGTSLGHDSVYDANSYLLAAAATRAGAIVYRVGIVPDDAATFRDALSDQLVRADLVITSGGVSEGDYDVVKESLRSLGTMWFGGVAMQPGKPQGFGTVGEDDTPIFTLPGNPVSAYISFQVFVLPAIRRMMGLLPYSRPLSRGLLTHAISSPPGRRQYLRGSYDVNAGRTVAAVTPVGGPGSHLIGDLAQANVLIVVPEDVTSLPAGEQVQVLRLDEDF